MDKKLKILFVTPEMSPLVSTGGLAEVASALPRALYAQGHDVRVAMPSYRSIDPDYWGQHYCLVKGEMGAKTEHGSLRKSRLPDSDIPLYLVEHEGYFGRDSLYGEGANEYPDNAERFCFFCQAVLDGIPQTWWKPDIVHCHDWHAASVPAFLKTRYAQDDVWQNTPTLFTIHNLAFQGRYDASVFPHTGLAPELFNTDCAEYEGDMNLMKTAIAFATKINTVSPRYSKEIQTLEYGCGLDGMLKTRAKDLSGILNGVDYSIWSPADDPHIAQSYSLEDMSGKALCKKALQQQFGLPPKDVPVFGLVSRLFWQKGIDLIVSAADALMTKGIQVVVLGSGDPDLEQGLRAAAERYPDQIGLEFAFNAELAHQIQAGSDFFLMPSRYEPCGLGQLYAMAYGTIPIVRRTGGLADSVAGMNTLNRRNGSATGVQFIPMSTGGLLRSVETALEIYSDKEQLKRIRHNGMTQDFSWDRSCADYVDLYHEAIDRP